MPSFVPRGCIGKLTTFILCGLFAVIASSAAARGQSAIDSGVRFNDLVGVNRAVQPSRNGHDALLGDVVQYNRTQVNWHLLEPTEGNFNDGALFAQSARIKTLNVDYGVETLPTLGFTPAWATDTSDVTFDFQDVTYRRRVDPNDSSRLLFSLTREGESDPFFVRDLSINTIQLPAEQEHVPDWKNFVDRAVITLGEPTSSRYDTAAGSEYFQPWNEPNPAQIFYHGSLEEYFNRINNPAAEVIRRNSPSRESVGIRDKKVVFGGWLASPSLGDEIELPDVLEDNNGWDNIDVLDVHYRSLEQLEAIRQRSAELGHGDIPIWQSEVSGTPVRRNDQGEITSDDSFPLARDHGSIANMYPRFAQWSNEHNDGDPDRYRSYWWRYYGENGFAGGIVDGLGYETLLEGDGNTLTSHGQALQTVGQLLGGGTLSNYDAVTTDSGLGFELDERASGIEAFMINADNEDGDRIVVSVHISDADEDGNVKVILPELDLARIESAQRVTPWNDDVALTAQEDEDGDVFFNVSTDDLVGPNGLAWEDASVLPRTFFVNLGLGSPIPEPASAALLGMGLAGMLLSRPKRAWGNRVLTQARP